MKKVFPGYFAHQNIDINELWANAILVLDTNVLLNFYRYSDQTQQEIFEMLERSKDRLWVPYQVAYEFLTNRLGVIAQQEKRYEETIAETKKILEKLEESRNHPFLDPGTMDHARENFADLLRQLEAHRSAHSARLIKDTIKDRIAELLDGKVGKAYSDDEIEEIIRVGRERYADKRPPGYNDSKKDSEGTSIASRSRPYADLIIWRSIIGRAKEKNQNIIFIIDDRKDDWWEVVKGKTIGPRVELLTEFIEEVGKEIYICRPDKYIELYKSRPGNEVSTSVLDEIKQVRQERQDFEDQSMQRLIEEEIAAIQSKLAHISDQRDKVTNAYKSFRAEAREIESHLPPHGRHLDFEDSARYNQYFEELVRERGDLAERDRYLAGRQEELTDRVNFLLAELSRASHKRNSSGYSREDLYNLTDQ